MQDPTATTAPDLRRVSAFGIPLLDLAAFDMLCCPEQVIDLKLIRKHRVLPLFQRSNRLFLAICDPADCSCLNDIKFHTGLLLDVVLVAVEQLQTAVTEFIARQETSQPGSSNLDATILRQAFFGNIQLRHYLDARCDASSQPNRRSGNFSQNAIDTKAHPV